MEVYQIKLQALAELGRYHEALEASESALLLGQNAWNFYYHGKIQEQIKNFSGAEDDYRKSISKDKKFIEGYIALADLRVRMDNLEGASESVEKALQIDKNSTEAHFVRSKIYSKKLDYPSAINDISKNILIEPENPRWFFVRGNCYQEFTQHMNAVNDFNKVLMLDKMYAEAYYKRAYSYEQIANFKMAIKDYQSLASLFKDDVKSKSLLEDAEKRLYELSRESEKPELKVIEPFATGSTVIELPKDKNQFVFKGLVKDESAISFVKVNDIEFPLLPVEEGQEFSATVNLAENDKFSVKISDIYNNVFDAEFTVQRTEIDAPIIKLLAPYASDDGQVFLDNNDPNIYLEGKITDESHISSIIIDGVSASYRPEDFNPVFSANLNITNKNKLTVTVRDKYGNESIQVYEINRSDISAENPMGRTWIVFIENSNYQTFASLDGPAKDVSLMKAAIAKYKIHNIIHKKDMSKKEMERFFSIELRDLIRSNRVNSILVWYAGHGKYINETGYWIPTDAKRDDEFTYFNISALKASLQSYSNVVTHTLVITDACESGPTFYSAMRDPIKTNRSCSDWNATQMKSSQVFSSAGYELAVDNSQFSRTFANSLVSNPDACLPIENIVVKVNDAVVRNKQQKPKFGKIEGLEDENGTFFFVVKD